MFFIKSNKEIEVKKEEKRALVTLQSSDLTLRISGIHSQSHDTIPVRKTFFLKKLLTTGKDQATRPQVYRPPRQ
jgi:hypothetical protein